MGFEKLIKNFHFEPCPLCKCIVSAWIEDTDDRSLLLHIECVNCPITYNGYLASGAKEPLDHDKLHKLVANWNTRRTI